MAKYRVTLSRKLYGTFVQEQEAVVEVETDSEAAAKAVTVAFEHDDSDWHDADDPDLETDELSQVKVVDVEEVE